MKNAANCVNQCELQDTLIIDVSNAHGGPGSLPGPRPVEGRLLPKRDFAVIFRDTAPRTVPRSLFRGRAWPFQSQTFAKRRSRGFFPFLFLFATALGGRFRRPPWGPVGESEEAKAPLSDLADLFLDLNSDEMTP